MAISPIDRAGGQPDSFMQGSFVPHFQPIVTLPKRQIAGFEVLARWADPLSPGIPPSVFIPLVERYGLLDALLESLMAQALAAAAAWPEQIFLAFNLSPRQLLAADLPARIARTAAAASCPLSRCHFEITETAVIEDIAAAGAVLEELTALGCRIVIDDFGTGSTSLTWLLGLPIAKIKIDRIFISSMLERRESREIVNAVVGLGRSLGLAIVAEGVETDRQEAALRDIGCGFAQGYLYARAVPAADVPALLQRFGCRPAGPLIAPPPPQQSSDAIAELCRRDDIAVGVLDTDGTLREANHAFLDRLGLPAERAVGRPVGELPYPGRDIVARLLKMSGSQRACAEVTLPSGRTDIVIAQDMLDEAGPPVGVALLAIDITGHGHSSGLGATMQGLVSANVVSPPGDTKHVLWGIYPDGRLMFVTRYWETLTSVVAQDLSPDDYAALVDPEQREIVMARWTHCLMTGETIDMDYRRRTADGSLQWIRVWGAPQRNAAGRIIAWYGSSTPLTPRPLTAPSQLP